MSNHRTTLVAALCASAAAFGLAACGEEDSDGSSGSGGDPPSAQEARAASVKFARCMREHGVDMPDPKVDEDGGLQIQVRGRPGSETNMDAAQKACQKYLPRGGKPPSEADQREFREAALAFARCMRENGVDMPDPQFQEGGRVLMGPGPGGEGKINPESPRFRKAQEACEDKLPGPRGKAGASASGGDE